MSDQGRLVAGRYRLIEQIGRGGMGTVWRAEDEVLGRPVALKRLHPRPELSDDERATLYERTRREARSAARVVHPHVVVVHDVVDDDGQPCIVMEHLAADTLAEVLKGGRTLTPQEAAGVGLGMVGALRAAHAAGVLHRDVKPGNVMLGPADRVVLTDFGIATTADTTTLTRTGEMVGSIDYMAPERIRGLRPGPASDLWSLGATLYQALEGRPPFRRATPMETAYAIAVDPPAPMKRAGPLEPLVAALLLKDPDERPSAEDTEQALLAARAGDTTVVLPSGRPAKPGPDGAGEDYDRASGTAPVPSAAAAGTGGGRERRRGRGRRRAVVTTTAAVAAAAVAVSGAVYATAHRHSGTSGTGARTKPRATAASATPAAVPAGYHRVEVKELGVSFAVPDGWRAGKRTADQALFTDRTGLAGITIGTVDPAGANPESHFTDIEANTKVNYPTSYRRLRMQQTGFRGQPAAVWEFTFKGRVRLFRAIDLGFGREGGREYDIYLSAPDAQWDTYRPVFDTVRDTFTTPGH
ncbi:serine/threonine-protein kinase [Streptomyces sp. Li-HN-5-13]|nr:serine/threonine-protein kinase [Streptomyces sp. Li-HN-5-13]